MGEQQQLIISDKSGVNSGYLQIVGSENIYIEKQSLAKISNRYVRQINPEKSEDEKRGSDGDHKASRKSLPHKKRISRKLKKQTTAIIKVQCSLCEQSFNSADDLAQHQMLCQTTITPINQSSFSCQICNSSFGDQLKFFEHLKSHYEPSNQNQSDTTLLAQEKIEILDPVDKDNIFTSLLNLTCIQCSKTFRRQKALEAHIRDVHQKEELNEFSETEDLMEGISVVVEGNEPHCDSDTKAW